jgi:hypothetical protein
MTGAVAAARVDGGKPPVMLFPLFGEIFPLVSSPPAKTTNVTSYNQQFKC